MAWLTGYTYRKAITIGSSKVTGGPHSNFPLYVQLGDDTDITAGAHSTGRDIRFTQSDGSTELKYELVPRGHYVSLDGAWTWFGGPNAIYVDGTNTRTFVGFKSMKSDRVGVQEYDHDDYEQHFSYSTLSVTDQNDDHNDPALVERSDGKILIAHAGHPSSVITTRVTSAAETLGSGWAAPSTMDPRGGTPAYTYCRLIRLTGEGTGDGRIYLFFRDTGGSTNVWSFVYSDDDGANWSTVEDLFADDDSGNKAPYPQFTSNGTDRIDVFITDSHPNQGNQELFHFYYDGAWKTSDGSSMGTPPAGGFTVADLDSSSVVEDSSSGTDTVWNIHAGYNNSGNPAILWCKFIADDNEDGEYWYSEWDSGDEEWDSGKIVDCGATLIDTTVYTTTYYIGGGCFDTATSDTDPTVFLSVQEGMGSHEIQRWQRSSGTWAKVQDITEGSSNPNFRPRCVQGAPDTADGYLVWVTGEYTHYSTGTPPHNTGIRCYPARNGSEYWGAYVKTTCDDDESIYVYYGKSDASDGQDSANVWDSNYLSVIHGYAAKDDPRNFPDSSGNGNYGTATDIVWDEPVDIGDAIHFRKSSSYGPRAVKLEQFTLESLENLTVEAWANYDSSGTDEHTLSNAWNTSTKKFLLRLEPNATADSVEWFINAVDGNLSHTTAGSVVSADTDAYIAGTFDHDGGGSGNARVTVRVNQTEVSADDTTSSAISSATAPAIVLGEASNLSGVDELHGYLWEHRVSDVVRSKNWTDTQYDNWTDATFYSLRTEETVFSPLYINRMTPHLAR